MVRVPGRCASVDVYRVRFATAPAGSLVGVQLKFQAWIVTATGNGRAQETPETIDILITYQAVCWGRPRSTYWQSD